MGIAGFPLARLPGQLDHIGSPLDQRGQHRIHLGHIVEAAQPVGARAQLTRSLGATQQELADDAKLLGTELQFTELGVAETVLIARHPGIETGSVDHQTAADQFVDDGADIQLGELEHGFAIALLVAGIDQCIERERVLIRRADLFLYQAADHASL
ncbi:hypothetical protein D3C80_1549960 [compost metagenome]